jgi:hypothetical protein
MRRVLAWAVTVPLVVAGSQLAHAAAYVLVSPDEHERSHELAVTGHGYFAYAPEAAGFLGAALLVALAVGVRAGQRLRVRAWPFGFLPVLAFAFQEHVERVVHTGAFPATAALEPSFVIGIALQIPFGMLAYLAASLLLHAAARLGRILRRRPPRLRPLPAVVLRPPATALPRPPLALAGCGVRGPPVARRP